MDCIFCKIIAGEIPSNKVYEDDTVLAFRDIEPKAPVHILVVPKKHITGAADVQSEDGEVIGHIFRVIAQVADQQGLIALGFLHIVQIRPLDVFDQGHKGAFFFSYVFYDARDLLHSQLISS